MDLESQKQALEKLLSALTIRMENRLKVIHSKDENAHSLLDGAQDYCQLIANKKLLEEELVRVIKEAIVHPVSAV